MREKAFSLVVFSVTFGVLLGLDAMFAQALAGTGGSEISSWWTDLTNALKGTWGKLIAAAFIGLAFIAGKSGGIIPAIFMFFLGISVGTIPDIVDARYTVTF